MTHAPIHNAADLRALNSRPESGPPLDDAQIASLLAHLPDWRIADGALEKSFAFKDYHGTLAFVNALAWIAHGEDHHPDLSVSYSRCVVRFSTHSVNGLSLNDFICAAKTDALMARPAGQDNLGPTGAFLGAPRA